MPYHSGRPFSFGYRVGTLARLQTRGWAHCIEALGIPFAGVPVMAELFFLQEDEGSPRDTSQDELVQRLALDKAAVARTLANLEKRGLIVRRINPGNKRQKLVSLTARGRELKGPLHNALKTMSDAMVEGFDPEEKAVALQFLDRMIINCMRYTNAEYGE
jgi:DNA-binding MarR family transcriptional regulator